MHLLCKDKLLTECRRGEISLSCNIIWLKIGNRVFRNQVTVDFEIFTQLIAG
jgi:hypothetical protein